MGYIDTHCHLDFPEFDSDRSQLIQRTRKCGVDYIINIGSNIKNSENAIKLSKEYDFIYATIGIHPHEADSFQEEWLSLLRKMAEGKKVVAIGEIGLDYYKNYSHKDNQLCLFKKMVSLAKELNLPLVIHSRQAQADTLYILKEAMPLRAVVHCFSGDEDFLRECLKLGFFVSYTCNITYKKAQDLRRLVLLTPLERIFLETDSPFLPPEGLRGKRNEPLHVKTLAEEIAKIKQESVDRVAELTSLNAREFFKLR
ncbi:MAG: TatD family hydrolase [Candidatus Omnitrophica bacterium]|nr:TatD family hydrolase [Candidatus Omnitrophota bacterium]